MRNTVVGSRWAKWAQDPSQADGGRQTSRRHTQPIPSPGRYVTTKVTGLKPKTPACSSDRKDFRHRKPPSGALSFLLHCFLTHSHSIRKKVKGNTTLPQRLPAQSTFSAHALFNGSILATSAWCFANASWTTPKRNREPRTMRGTPPPPKCLSATPQCDVRPHQTM